MKKILPPTYFLIAIILMVILHLAVPVYQLLTLPWRLLGLIPMVVGIAMPLLADRAFKKHNTTVKPFEASTALVTTGVFAISRNPMYLGLSLILLGIALLLGSAAPLAVVVLFPVLLDRRFVAAEQRMLQATFGERYQQYRQQVRKWI
jgi:protein-S-isoprenylcysteine O-methyltransferase Ste14